MSKVPHNQIRNPEVDEVTPELLELLAQFTEEEIASGVVASPNNTEQVGVTPDEIVQLCSWKPSSVRLTRWGTTSRSYSYLTIRTSVR